MSNSLSTGCTTAFVLCTWVVIGSALHPIKEEMPSFNDTAFCLNRANSSIFASASASTSMVNASTPIDWNDFEQFKRKYQEEMDHLPNKTQSSDDAGEDMLTVKSCNNGCPGTYKFYLILADFW